ncbi:hypothetical protein [Saezia sanguinis]|nr:hypothetical protein [Saezia sanguinis]
MTEDDKKALEAINYESDKVLKICLWFGVLPMIFLILFWLGSGVIESADALLNR